MVRIKFKCPNHCDASEFPYPFYFPDPCVIPRNRKDYEIHELYTDEYGELTDLDINGKVHKGKFNTDGCNPTCIICKTMTHPEDMMEVINLPERWTLTRIDYPKGETWIFHHRCNPSHKEPLLGRLQMNTHRRYGKRYRCDRCKSIAPKQVVMHMRLKKIGDKR